MLNQNLLLGDDGYLIQRSLRFRSSASAYLNRTPSSAGNRKVFTWSGWVKRGTLGTFQTIFGASTTTGSRFSWEFTSGNALNIAFHDGTLWYEPATSAVFRDPSAWYHIVVACDLSQATSSNRIKVYVNGTQQTLTGTYPPNFDSYINSSNGHQIGAYSTQYFDGYMAEINFIDGQALTPSSFGETDAQTGVWKPKKYSGTYGTNGFYLNFSDNSNNTAATIGKDSSGNGNNWTPNNISVTSGATYDSMTDVPTLTSATQANYAVINPLVGIGTLSNANLTITGVTGDNLRHASIGVSSGKWYVEFYADSMGSGSMGVAVYSASAIGTVNGVASRGYYYTGQKYSNGSLASYGNSFTTGDIIGIAVDLDNNKLWFSKNGTWQASGDPVAGTNAAYTDLTLDTWFVSIQGGNVFTASANFGQRPFAYTPPTGFKALNTFNLPTPTIGATASTQANKYFDAKLYTGNGTTTNVVSGFNFSPDFIWVKNRSGAYNHTLMDIVRGTAAGLSSNNTAAEDTNNYFMNSFNSDGFSLRDGASVNRSGDSFVAWCWKANGSGVTNTAGSITTTVSVNQAAGFSIVTYTGTGSNATIGHGLSVAPKIWFWKNRDSSSGEWAVNYNFLNNSMRYMFLNSTAAQADNSASYWGNAPTSTVNYIGASDANTNINGQRFVMYAFAEVAGFSRIGSYTGNGSTDGPFVFCGFRPRFVMIKRTDAAGNSWLIYDTARVAYNANDLVLYPNASNAEDSGVPIDVLSNGFKQRSTWTNGNASGGTYIYMALAENPFKYSLAR